MTKKLEDFKKYTDIYRETLLWLQACESDYLDDVHNFINNYFNDYSIDNSVYDCSSGIEVGCISIILNDNISFDIVYEIAKILDLEVYYYKGVAFSLKVKEDDIHD